MCGLLARVCGIEFDETGTIEERRVIGSFHRVSEISETDTDKAKEAARAEVDTISQGKSDVGELLAGCGRNGWRVASGMNIEFASLELEHDRACDA